jgi:hypothetical protein
MSDCPSYYRLADGREFFDYCGSDILPMLQEMESMEVHCVVSALEHAFRLGRKPGTDQHDEKAQAWWMGKARSLFMERKRRECTETSFHAAKLERKFDALMVNVFGNVLGQRDLAIRVEKRRGKS